MVGALPAQSALAAHIEQHCLEPFSACPQLLDAALLIMRWASGVTALPESWVVR